eukprot:Nk52_evm1s790 gene=Nk52_evmTU1s790
MPIVIDNDATEGVVAKAALLLGLDVIATSANPTCQQRISTNVQNIGGTPKTSSHIEHTTLANEMPDIQLLVEGELKEFEVQLKAEHCRLTIPNCSTKDTKRLHKVVVTTTEGFAGDLVVQTPRGVLAGLAVQTGTTDASIDGTGEGTVVSKSETVYQWT